MKTLLLLAILVATGLGCTSAAITDAPGSGSTGNEEPRYGGILTLGTRGDPAQGFDSMRATNFEVSVPGAALYGDRNLVKPCRENNNQVCAGLAERWESNQDFTEWTFKVRDGVLWHDGQAFSAEDAKFWIDLSVFGARSGEKVRAPSVSKAQFGPVSQVDALPGNLVRVKLSRPAPIYPTQLAMFYPLLLQHPRHLMHPRIEQGEVNVTPQEVGHVGTGPFRMDSQEKGTGMQFRRFDRYWETDSKGNRLPYLDGIDYIVFTDPAAMDAAFRTGRLDGGARGAGYTLSTERREAYERSLSDRVWFAEIGGGNGARVSFNALRPGPAQDVRVRRALSLWTDRREAIQGLGGGMGALTTFTPPESPWPSPDFQTWPGYNQATREADRNEARRLLRDAGFANGVTLKYMCRKAWATNCEWFSGHLAPLGVRADIELVDDANWQEAARQANFDLMEAAISGSYPEATEVRLNARSQNPTSQVAHDDPKVADFFNRLTTAAAMEDRQRIYRELERYMLLDQVYAIATFEGYSVVPYRSYVKGVLVPLDTVAANVDFAPVWLEK